MEVRVKATFLETENLKSKFHEDSSLQSDFTESENIGATFEDDEELQADFEDEEQFRAGFDEAYILPTDNYDDLYNKPIHQKTTAEWNAQPQLISKKGNLYFYIDRYEVGGKLIPAVKLGDGTSYLIDLPFMDAKFDEHIRDNIRHITQAERVFWNNKNRAEVTGETLLLRKD